MTFIISLVVLLLVWRFAPKWFWVTVLSLIIGLAIGGFFWSIAAMFCSQLITLTAFAVFVVVAQLVSAFFIWTA